MSYKIKLGYDFIQGTREITYLYRSVLLTDGGIKADFKKKYIGSFCIALKFTLNVKLNFRARKNLSFNDMHIFLEH
jgi:hypothetical protein